MIIDSYLHIIKGESGSDSESNTTLGTRLIHEYRKNANFVEINVPNA